MQLALIITLTRRAFSDVYPVIKLDLRFLVACYLLFSAVAPSFVLSISLPPTVRLSNPFSLSLQPCSKHRNRNYFHAPRFNVIQDA